VLRLGQHVAPLVDEAKIEVCFGPVRAEVNGEPQRIRRPGQVAALEQREAGVEEQIPARESERGCAPVLAQFLRAVAHHPLREARMVVRERVGRMLAQEVAMETDRLGIVLRDEKIIGRRLADGTFARVGSGAYRRAERHEQQRNPGDR
jgi:hypothetical protein